VPTEQRGSHYLIERTPRDSVGSEGLGTGGYDDAGDRRVLECVEDVVLVDRGVARGVVDGQGTKGGQVVVEVESCACVRPGAPIWGRCKGIRIEKCG
jgi:hypothetical protein